MTYFGIRSCVHANLLIFRGLIKNVSSLLLHTEFVLPVLDRIVLYGGASWDHIHNTLKILFYSNSTWWTTTTNACSSCFCQWHLHWKAYVSSHKSKAMKNFLIWKKRNCEELLSLLIRGTLFLWDKKTYIDPGKPWSQLGVFCCQLWLLVEN